MIRHILKIIWNERKVNLWVMLEYVVVFCVLWFCCDYLYYLGKNYLEDPGFDTSNTYLIRMGKKDLAPGEQEDRATYLSQLEDRVMHFPGVENMAVSYLSIPYSPYLNANGYLHNNDSVWFMMKLNKVTPGFFDLYRMKLERGRSFDTNDMITGTSMILTPDRNGNMGIFGSGPVPVREIETVKLSNGVQWNVVGVYAKTKQTFYDPYTSTAYEALAPSDIDFAHMDISIRVSREQNDGFVDRFIAAMREPLFIGPYFLITVIPSREIEKKTIDEFVTNNLNSVLAVTGFLMVNIFLALIGTFWSRTQSRRSEIGLRIAMGASRRNVQNMMFAETLIMLLVASVLSTYICLNLAQTELLASLGIPLAERAQSGMGSGQDIINFAITFGFMAIVSCLAVWYPARQSSNIAPAEALRDE